MNRDEILAAASMPLHGPAYPHLPYRFVNREFMIVTYRTDPAALRKLVPEPLQVPEPVVKYEFINMPDVSGLGAYTESGQVVPVELDGEAGGYTIGMYLDSFAGTVAGRELTGFPKLIAQPRLMLNGDCLVGTLDYGGLRVATATMTYKRRALPADALERSLTAPGFLLKMIPGADGRPQICQINRYRALDVTVKGGWSGDATLELHPHVMAPVYRLPVLEVLSAVHMVADLSLGAAETVHDYLA